MGSAVQPSKQGQEMSNVTINPAWKAYNDGMNEGGEGFNPHSKWIAKVAPVSSAVAAAQSSRMLRGADGNLIPESKVRARLEKNIAKLPSLTNASAAEIISAEIAADRALLA